MVTCTAGFDAKSDVIDPLGICQCVCGTSLCDLSISNTCDSGVCKCGDAPQCDTTSTIPACLSSTGTTPVRGDSTATCKVGYISQSLHYPICYYCLNYDNLYILWIRPLFASATWMVLKETAQKREPVLQACVVYLMDLVRYARWFQIIWYFKM